LTFGLLTRAIDFSVDNDARFIVTGRAADGTNGLVISSSGGDLALTVEDSGRVNIDCGKVQFRSRGSRILVANMGRMSLSCSGPFAAYHTAFLADSSPKSGLSLSLAVAADGPETMSLASSSMLVLAAATGLLRCPELLLTNGTLIGVAETAACSLQFDSVVVQGNSVFDLGKGEAKMQFDSYTDGKVPFDFINKNYPEGLFNIISDGTVNGGTFVIRATSQIEANAIIGKKLVAIDGVVQSGFTRLSSIYDGQYVTVKQTKV
jgi:hypothetical protein